MFDFNNTPVPAPSEKENFLYQGSRELTSDQIDHIVATLKPIFDSPIEYKVQKKASRIIAEKCLREEITFQTVFKLWELLELEIKQLEEVYSKPVPEESLRLSEVLQDDLDKKHAVKIEIELISTIQKPLHFNQLTKELETGILLVLDSDKKQTFRERIKYNFNGDPDIRSILVLEVCLDELTIYDSPISEEPRRFKVRFKTAGKGRPLSIGPCFREDVIQTLKDNNYIASKRFGEDAITGSINLFEQRGKAEMKTDIETPGFFFNKNTNELVNAKYDVEMPDTEEIRQGFQVLKEFVEWFPGVEVKVATIFKWGLIAPFAFARKQMGAKWIPYLFLYGQAGSGKSRLGQMVLYLWEGPDDETNNLGGGSFDTEARIGGALSKFTFPIVVDEPAGVLMKPNLLEIIKNAVIKTVLRSKYNQGRLGNIPSYSPVILTSNVSSPQDIAFGRRIETMNFTHSEMKTQDDMDSFDNLFQMDSPRNSKLNALKAISQAVAVEILADPDLLMKPWKELANQLISRLHGDMGEKPPSWLLEWMKTETIADIEDEQRESIRILISNHLNREMKKIPLVDDEYRHVTLETTDKVRDNTGFKSRVWYVINEGLVPWMIPFHNSKTDKNYVCLTIGFKKELQQELKICQTLKGIAELMGWNYTAVKLPTKTKVIKINFDKFLEMIYRRGGGSDDQKSL